MLPAPGSSSPRPLRVGLLGAAWAPAAAGLLTGTALLAAGVAFITPALFAATFARLTATERGAAAGTATFFIDLGFGGGPLVLGFVAAASGSPAAFAVGAAIALAGATGTLIAPRLGRAPSTA